MSDLYFYPLSKKVIIYAHQWRSTYLLASRKYLKGRNSHHELGRESLQMNTAPKCQSIPNISMSVKPNLKIFAFVFVIFAKFIKIFFRLSFEKFPSTFYFFCKLVVELAL